MRERLPENLEKARVLTGHYASTRYDGANGAFIIKGPTKEILRIIACDGTDPDALEWEHVSISCGSRPPFWSEMCFVKNLFWEEEECVIQFHPPKSQYVNCHPFTLHLWRHTKNNFPTPSTHLIGPT